jgi:glycosyltransferase involved in cell wall biosynthesis
MTATTEQINSGVMALTGGAERQWPRIALVTPVLNAVKYIEPTIRSVLAQDYPNLDYFIVDGGSTDGTVEIIRKYEGQISGWISEPDNGMYDALNKGFARTSGEIMGWISGTDMLHIGGLKVAADVFRKFPQVEWITGRPTAFNEGGMTVAVCPLRRFSRWRYLAGANQAIQQESTFWRRSLWEKAGGRVDDSRRMWSDFELWVRFFRHARLYPVDTLIGGFRVHGDSIGIRQTWECFLISLEVVDAELARSNGDGFARFLRRVTRAVEGIPKVQGLWNLGVLKPLEFMLYKVPGPDWPPVIEHSEHGWRMRR